MPYVQKSCKQRVIESMSRNMGVFEKFFNISYNLLKIKERKNYG
jgi:hypothetical protein